MSAQDDKAREIADAFAPFNRAIKSAHSLILNRLNQMQRAPYYATAHDELALAEQTIVDQERQNATLLALAERVAKITNNSHEEWAEMCAIIAEARRLTKNDGASPCATSRSPKDAPSA